MTGLKELRRDLKRADAETDKELRKKFKEVGDLVRVEATSLFSSYDARSATGYRTRVRQRGISVEQSRKNRGGSKRPNYTQLQNRVAMEPALENKRDEVVDKLEEAIKDISNMVK